MAKRRILFTGEASFLSTGFATFNREIIKRLHASGKYEIAEMGSYASAGDERIKKLPWKFYPVLPATQNEKQVYESHQQNQFGRYKIDAVLADFQPDIVYDARDPWMVEHLVDNRFRQHYRLVLTPTVDSAPQKKAWIDGIFKKADAVTTYSRYGKRVLEEDGVNIKGVTSPGVLLDLFKPLDRATTRDKFHITPSLLVFGTVMRNQKRKLLPDLFDAYKKLRDRHVKPRLIERAKKKVKEKKTLSKEEKNALRIDHSVLYCHTSYPDLGWDIPDYLMRNQLQRHVLFTYLCESCDAVYANWFTPCNKKGVSTCRVCGEHSAHMPNTHKGITQEQLADVFNLFDVYIQPAICEGWGLPIMEAKSCGVPGLYQNYSAMEDHVENGGGQPIKIGRFYHEAETGAIRSLPNIDDLVTKMEKFATNKKMRKRLAEEARECAEKMHKWEITTDKLQKIFDELELIDREDGWDSRPNFKIMTTEQPPQKSTPADFVHWCYINILQRVPDKEGMENWVGKLQKGSRPEEILKYFHEKVATDNQLEEARWKNSLRRRGIKLPTDELNLSNDFAPGVLV
jgi:glycosyltransferase involved in cell wall biosynthesis